MAAYAPTDVEDKDIKNAYYNQLQNVTENICPPDIYFVLTDANAMISSSFNNTLEQHLNSYVQQGIIYTSIGHGTAMMSLQRKQ